MKKKERGLGLCFTIEYLLIAIQMWASSLVGAGAGLGWLVLVFLSEENTVGWLV